MTVGTNLTGGLALHIRRVDGDNTMPARELGAALGRYLDDDGCKGCVDLVADFVERTNPDKELGAGALAELIAAEFNLDEE